jgi:hypothetical protein
MTSRSGFLGGQPPITKQALRQPSCSLSFLNAEFIIPESHKEMVYYLGNVFENKLRLWIAAINRTSSL